MPDDINVVELRQLAAADRVLAALTDPAAAPAWFWLSFVSEHDFSALGGCWVLGPSTEPMAATVIARHAGCNPGGSVMIQGPYDPTEVAPREELTYRLLPPDEVKALNDSAAWVVSPDEG